jgi:PncC family amidohydrolase
MLRALQATLKSRGATVATAESCTGGLVATLLTDLAGSSDVYVGGVSAYSNGVKTAFLGVPEALIARHGAVSPEVAAAMAKGAAERVGATYAVSLTGVAGPGGGSAEKPVGTVYCGIAGPAGVRAIKLFLPGDRTAIRTAAAHAALGELARECGAAPGGAVTG